MVLKDIMAISGQPGLFRFIAQGKNAIIVEHLETKMRSSAFNSARVSSLEEISIFTREEDMPLGKVFDVIYEKENGGPAINYKAEPDKLKAWFEEILPLYDKEKVYVSDIKKVAQWYNILQTLNLLVKEEPEKPEEPEKSAESAEPEKSEGTDKKAEIADKVASKKKAQTKKEPEPGSKSVSKGKGDPAPKKKPAKSGNK
jgi:hypothetical protein